MEYYSAVKKDDIFVICSNIDRFGGQCVKWSKSERER